MKPLILHPEMDKDLMVYPIPAGSELNVFSTESIRTIKIMDMRGELFYSNDTHNGLHNIINIQLLPCDTTYMVEVCFDSGRNCRSVFVKL